MPSEFPPPYLLLLHDGGWDEVLMVAAALGIAYLVIVWTGRRSRDEEDDELYDDALDADPPEATSERRSSQRS